MANRDGRRANAASDRAGEAKARALAARQVEGPIRRGERPFGFIVEQGRPLERYDRLTLFVNALEVRLRGKLTTEHIRAWRAKVEEELAEPKPGTVRVAVMANNGAYGFDWPAPELGVGVDPARGKDKTVEIAITPADGETVEAALASFAEDAARAATAARTLLGAAPVPHVHEWSREIERHENRDRIRTYVACDCGAYAHGCYAKRLDADGVAAWGPVGEWTYTEATT